MPQSDLTDLLDIAAASQARSLHQLAIAAVRSVVGCSAANVVRWEQGEPVLAASTHPDLAVLVEVQARRKSGPVFDALSLGEPVTCPDTLDEERWPQFAAAALRLGVRCSLTLCYGAWPGVLSLTMVGARPRTLDPRRTESAEMLASLGGAILGAVEEFDEARRTASQLQDAADSRAAVDQAKGILMHALGCSADEALERLRQVSQQRNIRAVDVARDLVLSAGRAADGGPARRGPAPGRNKSRARDAAR